MERKLEVGVIVIKEISEENKVELMEGEES